MKSVEIVVALSAVALGYLVLCRYWKLDDDYEKLPKLFMLDDYDECMENPEGLYCLVDIELTTEEPSELWYRIKNVSANLVKYFQHDIVHRGICVTKNSDLSVSAGALHSDEHVLQAVLDELAIKELKEKYGFGGKVTVKLCESKHKLPKTSPASWIFVGILVSIILANIGPCFLQQCDEKQGLGRELVQAFNISSNWTKLTSQNDQGKNWLRGVQGLRTIIMDLVILAHIPIIVYSTYINNPEVIEMLHDSYIVKALFSGTLIIQIFFCLSSFLMSYQFLKYAENNQKVGFKDYLMFILQRWLRAVQNFCVLFCHVCPTSLTDVWIPLQGPSSGLKGCVFIYFDAILLTPAYAVVIGFVALWSEKLATGPLKILYNLEANTCREVWWSNLLYTNNFFNGLMCVPQAWYLAVDTQLHCFGLFVMIMVWKLPRFAKHILGGTLTVATVVPGVLTYIREYPAALLITPETLRECFQKNDTFLNIYTKIQGNASSFTIGLIAGYVQFHLERRKINLLQIKGVTYLLHAIVPITLCVMIFGILLYTDEVFLSPLTAAIFAALNKPIIACLFGFFLMCIASKLEVKLLESRILVIPGRLTYCALLVHVAVQKYLVSALDHPVQIGYLLLIWLAVASIAITYFFAMLLCLFVEVPFCNVQKILVKLLTQTSKSVQENGSSNGASRAGQNLADKVRND